MTDFLCHATIRMRLHHKIVDILKATVSRSQASTIVDLCSGGGGLLAGMQRELSTELGEKLNIVFTDKYPNLDALSRLCAQNPKQVNFERDSVDATAVPTRLRGVRTLFSAFHHFPPPVARDILQDAVCNRQPIAIFEVSRRSIAGLVPMLLSPLATWMLTPSIRPLTWRRLFFTYIVPAVPFFVMWDGIVSSFRTYSPKELQLLVMQLKTNNYCWEIKRISAPLGYKITYLTGIPG